MSAFKKYFRLLKEKGEDCDILTLELKRQGLVTNQLFTVTNDDLERHDHCRTDAMQILINKFNIDRDKKFTTFDRQQRPSWFHVLRGYRNFLKYLPYENDSLPTILFGKGEPLENKKYYFIFTKEDSRKLYLYIKNNQLSWTSLLISSLSKSIKIEKQTWLTTFFLTDLYKGDYISPAISFIDLQIHSGAKTENIHQQYLEKKNQGHIWGSWLAMTLWGLAPKKLRSKSLDTIIKKTKRTGLLTNLGRWDIGSEQNLFLVWAPALTIQPLAVIVSYEDEMLALTLHVHNSLLVSGEELMKKWVEQLKNMI